MSTFTLTTWFIINFIKIILDLRLINIIENYKRKQKTRTYKYKQKRQIKLDLEQEYIKNCCCK